MVCEDGVVGVLRWVAEMVGMECRVLVGLFGGRGSLHLLCIGEGARRDERMVSWRWYPLGFPLCAWRCCG